MSRTYNFELPYEVNSFYVSAGIGQLKSEGIFENLPTDLQERFEAAASSWQGVTISREDCDEIDDATWAKIAEKLGLSWE